MNKKKKKNLSETLDVIACKNDTQVVQIIKTINFKKDTIGEYNINVNS